MKKRTSIFYITTVAVAIVCLILDLIFQDISFSFLGICFAITMLVYGFCLIVRGFRFKIDSSLFLGIIIFVFGIITTITYFTPYGYFALWHYLLLGVSLASFVTGMYFKISTQKKLSLFFLGLFAIALLYQLNVFGIAIMIIVMAIYILGFIITNNLLYSRRK